MLSYESFYWSHLNLDDPYIVLVSAKILNAARHYLSEIRLFDGFGIRRFEKENFSSSRARVHLVVISV